VYMRLFSTY